MGDPGAKSYEMGVCGLISFGLASDRSHQPKALGLDDLGMRPNNQQSISIKLRSVALIGLE